MSTSNNNTTIGISVDASGVEAGVNKLRAGASNIKQSTDQMARQAALVESAMKEAAEGGFELNARAANKLAKEYLNLEATAGKTRQQILDQKAAAAGVTSTFASMSEQIKQASAATHEFGFNTAQSKRELLVLGHELSQGNYKRFGGSLMVLAEQTGAAGLLFSAAGIAAIALGGALVGVSVEVAKGYLAFDALNKSASLTGGYLGLTTSQLQAMSASLASPTAGLIEVEEAMTGLIASGKMSADTLSLATRVTVDFAADTGQAVDKVVESMVKFAEDPKKALIELQGQYHTFSAAQAEVIEGYIHAGDNASAYKAILEGLDDAHKRFKESAEDNVGYVVKLYRGLKEIVTGVGSAIASIGVQTTAQQNLNTALTRQKQLQDAIAANTARGAPDTYGYKDKLAEANAQVAAAQAVVDAQTKRAAAQAKAAAGGDAVVAAHAYLDDTKYADPTRRRLLDIQKENEDFGKATKNLDAASSEYEEVVKRHQENLATIDKQYAKRTAVHTNDGAANQEIARIRGLNTLIEAEEKRSEITLKSQRDAGLIDTETYFKSLRDIQAKALDEQIANQAALAEAAGAKKQKATQETALAEYKKLVEQRATVDAQYRDSVAKYQRQRDDDITKYRDKQFKPLQSQLSGYDEEDATRVMTVTQADQYKQLLALRQRYYDSLTSLATQYNAHQIDATTYAAEQKAASDAYVAETASLKAHLDSDLAYRNDYAAQVKKAMIQIAGPEQTGAETVASGLVTVWDDASKALEDFVTKGKVNFASLTTSIIADLSKMALKSAENKLFNSLLSSGGNLLSSLLGGSSSTAALTGISYPTSTAGTSSVGSNTYGFHLASGGAVHGPGSSTSDSIPAMLSNDEGVMNARAMRNNPGLLDAVNSGRSIKSIAHYADGGYVGSRAATVGSDGGSSLAPVINVNQTAPGTEVGDIRTRKGPQGQTIIDMTVRQAERRIARSISSGQGVVPKALGTRYGMRGKPGGS